MCLFSETHMRDVNFKMVPRRNWNEYQASFCLTGVGRNCLPPHGYKIRNAMWGWLFWDWKKTHIFSKKDFQIVIKSILIHRSWSSIKTLKLENGILSLGPLLWFVYSVSTWLISVRLIGMCLFHTELEASICSPRPKFFEKFSSKSAENGGAFWIRAGTKLWG